MQSDPPFKKSAKLFFTQILDEEKNKNDGIYYLYRTLKILNRSDEYFLRKCAKLNKKINHIFNNSHTWLMGRGKMGSPASLENGGRPPHWKN